MSRRPVHEVRVGLVVARVREFKRRGKIHHSISVHRLFRNGDCWTESQRFAFRDIPSVSFVLDEAHRWLLVRKQSLAQESP